MLWKRRLLTWGSATFLSLALAQATLAQETIVQPGDSLWSIAQRHQTTVEALKEANGLSADRLNPGHVLKLPGSAQSKPLTYTVQAGDTPYKIALSFGLSINELIAINNLDGHIIRVGQVLKLTSDANDAPATPLVITVQPGDSLWLLAHTHDVSWQAIADANGIPRANPTLRVGTRLTIPGRYTTGQAQGGYVPPSITVARGDTLEVLARRHDTTVSALMAANDLRGTMIRAGQTLRIAPADGLSAAVAAPRTAATAAGALLRPHDGPVTSRFGYRQLRVAGSNFHTGVDFAGRTGEPIRAAAGGTVTFSGWQHGYGNIVIIRSGDREYRYAHASALLVEPGATVAAGEVIARVGSTGFSTGPHLHFEVLIGGAAVDPLPLIQNVR
jgi:murein DD-endopeptidase MepM/ murein hydrolase activator NlpD